MKPVTIRICSLLLAIALSVSIIGITVQATDSNEAPASVYEKPDTNVLTWVRIPRRSPYPPRRSSSTSSGMNISPIPIRLSPATSWTRKSVSCSMIRWITPMP